MEFTQNDKTSSTHEDTGKNRYRSYYSDLSQVKEEWLDEEMRSLTARYEEISSEKQRRKAIRAENSQNCPSPQEFDSLQSALEAFLNNENSHQDTDAQLQVNNSRTRPTQVTQESDIVVPTLGSTSSNNTLQEIAPGNPQNRMFLPAVGNDSDGTHYHMNTRTLREGGPAAPYSDLPEEEFYAPGITIERYKAFCSTFCGVVKPSRVQEGAKPQQPVRRGPLVNTAESKLESQYVRPVGKPSKCHSMNGPLTKHGREPKVKQFCK
ncbi:MAG: hypothetical protein Q9225_001830 [Loekoesia sp. 1 TL-2023]